MPTQTNDPGNEFLKAFCFRAEWCITQALAEIGLSIEPQVLLVCTAPGDGLNSRLSGFTKDGQVPKDQMQQIAEIAAEIVNGDDERTITHSDPQLNSTRTKLEFQLVRAGAIARGIEESQLQKGVSFFASARAPAHGHDVHTCVGVKTAALDLFPALEGPVIDRLYVGRSLQHEVIDECLRRADRSFLFWDPNSGDNPLGPAESVVRSAASQLADGFTRRVAGQASDLFPKMEAITSRTYERSGATGRLAISNSDRSTSTREVRFRHPVPIEEDRTIRKLLELTDGETAVLTSQLDDASWGLHAYGIGSCDPAQEVIDITVRGHADWELAIDETAFMRVTHGHAKLPTLATAPGQFADTATQTFDCADSSRLWSIVDTAVASRHGMTIVVTDQPEAEAERLSGQAIVIEPQLMPPAEIVRLGRVDGAVLLGPDGKCHAFGIILDGMATDNSRSDEQRSRGSRYNSAVRYQTTTTHNSLLVVISDDGMVNLIAEPNIGKE